MGKIIQIGALLLLNLSLFSSAHAQQSDPDDLMARSEATLYNINDCQKNSPDPRCKNKNRLPKIPFQSSINAAADAACNSGAASFDQLMNACTNDTTNYMDTCVPEANSQLKQFENNYGSLMEKISSLPKSTLLNKNCADTVKMADDLKSAVKDFEDNCSATYRRCKASCDKVQNSLSGLSSSCSGAKSGTERSETRRLNWSERSQQCEDFTLPLQRAQKLRQEQEALASAAAQCVEKSVASEDEYCSYHSEEPQCVAAARGRPSSAVAGKKQSSSGGVGRVENELGSNNPGSASSGGTESSSRNSAPTPGAASPKAVSSATAANPNIANRKQVGLKVSDSVARPNNANTQSKSAEINSNQVGNIKVSNGIDGNSTLSFDIFAANAKKSENSDSRNFILQNKESENLRDYLPGARLDPKKHTAEAKRIQRGLAGGPYEDIFEIIHAAYNRNLSTLILEQPK